MRITRLIAALSLFAVASCAKADAATVDPTRDYDCAISFRVFREVAENQAAPDKVRQGLFIMEQWYGAKWDDEHANTPDPTDHGDAIIKAMAANPEAYKEPLKACTTRAAADPHFDRFARLMQQRMPDAR
jgi:hypothetical protein